MGLRAISTHPALCTERPIGLLGRGSARARRPLNLNLPVLVLFMISRDRGGGTV